jgi:hypothetical protein
MKLHNKSVYLEYQDITTSGIPEGTIKAALARESSSWAFITDPADKRKVLFHYESLKDKYKEQVRAKFGCPYKFMAAQIIKQHLTNSPEDLNTITGYKLPDGSTLPVSKQQEYITACSYLNFLSKLSAKTIRALGYKSTTDFYDAIIQLIKGDSIPLPESYANLRTKARAYRDDGALTVISKKFCNKNSLKVKDEVSESLLLEMISHSSQFEDVFVARKYNQWAKGNGYKEITDATVGIWRRKNALSVTASREGHAVWHNQFNPVIARERASAPLLCIESDDNNLDLFFREGTGKDSTNFRRVTLMVVMDTFNDYPLGYAIGRSQTEELVHEAYLNAIHHIKELTGEQTIWQQIRTDSWGLKRLADWYSMQAVFTKTQTGNARGKYIEQFFGKKWHSILRQYKNYGGNNITAQTQRNRDTDKLNAKNFPGIEHAPAQIAHFFAQLRSRVSERTGKTKQQEWLEAYRALPAADKRSLPDTQRLLLFGKRHQYQNKITNTGINITLNRHPLIFDIPKADYAKHVGKTMQVIYDPYDLSSVLAIADDARVQILCPVMEKMKSALADFQPGDRARLNVKLGDKKELSQQVLNGQRQRQELLSSKGIHAESILQAGVMIKEDRQLAENTYYEHEQLNEQPAQQQDEEDIFDLMIRKEKQEGDGHE